METLRFEAGCNLSEIQTSQVAKSFFILIHLVAIDRGLQGTESWLIVLLTLLVIPLEKMHTN